MARNSLAILLGMTPGALDERLEEFQDISEIPDTDIALELPAELLRRRPDVRRSERNLASQTARIGVATADLYPSFSLTGAHDPQAAEFSNLGDAAISAGHWLPGSRWNLFTGGKIRGQIKAEEAITEQLLARIRKNGSERPGRGGKHPGGPAAGRDPAGHRCRSPSIPPSNRWNWFTPSTWRV